MKSLAIRKRLMIYLADADDKKVRAIYALLEDEINQESVKNLDEREGDFVVEPHIVTDEDKKVISEAINYYKANGKFKRVAKTKKI